MCLALSPGQARRLPTTRAAWLSSLALQHQGEFLTPGVTLLINLYCINHGEGLALGYSVRGSESEVGCIMCPHLKMVFSLSVHPWEKDRKRIGSMMGHTDIERRKGTRSKS